MKKITKILLTLGAVASLVGCTGKKDESFETDYLTFAGYGIDQLNAFAETLSNKDYMSFNCSVVSKQELVGSYTSDTNMHYLIEVDNLNFVYHLKIDYSETYVDLVDPTENEDDHRSYEIYFVFDNQKGLVAYENDDGDKETVVIVTNNSIYGYCASEDYTLRRAVCEIASNLVFDVNDVAYSGNIRDIYAYDTVEQYLGLEDGEVTEQKFVINPATNDFSFVISGKCDTGSTDIGEAELKSTRTWKNEFKGGLLASVDNSVVSTEIYHVSETESYIWNRSSSDTVSTSDKGAIVLPDFADYID